MKDLREPVLGAIASSLVILSSDGPFFETIPNQAQPFGRSPFTPFLPIQGNITCEMLTR
ncbi:hypothetical protein ACQ4M4_09085 [Leptolyngbya sp. AN02str]|uniref:hypothetical protein n=1 Tax=Leptolyngbya sp. AN02str TaxID=3423363 RepID=UPI003D3212CD